MNAKLSLGQGRGLRMLMSDQPCRANPAGCHGAKMAADHVQSTDHRLYGDYELTMRAPYTLSGDGSTCAKGIYAYFTAGYTNTHGKWNEMNFGFHPDRDDGGTKVSCEHHDDTGGYHESSYQVGFNYRRTFATWIIRLRKEGITWLVKKDGAAARTLHHASAKLTEPMHTSLIFRTNFRAGDPGFMQPTAMEVSAFKFTPA